MYEGNVSVFESEGGEGGREGTGRTGDGETESVEGVKKGY